MAQWLTFWLPFALALLVVANAHTLALVRPDDEMVVEDVEFPYTAVDDNLAGAPGVPLEDHNNGPAHVMRGASQPVENPPCDMTGSSSEYANGEDPVSPRPGNIGVAEDSGWQTVDEEIDVFKPLSMKEFVCRATQRWPEVYPRIEDRFNLYHATFEGNDRRGQASRADYAPTECACTCSGLEQNCGLAGSISYYSEVPDATSCAQIICHVNKFSKCVWSSIWVSRGIWTANTVHFNSTALETLKENSTMNGPPYSQQPFVPVLPSPSPSPSPLPTFAELVEQQVQKILKFLAESVCLAVHPKISAEILQEAQATNLSDPLDVKCLQKETFVVTQGNLRELMAKNDELANAFAGMSNVGSLSMPSTKKASSAMNDGALVQVESSNDVIFEAWRLVVRLFRNNVPLSMQCAPDAPDMQDLLAESAHMPSCNSTHLHQILLQATTTQSVASTVLDFYRIIATKLHIQYLLNHPTPSPSMSPSVTPHPSPLRHINRTRNSTREFLVSPSPSPSVPTPDDEDQYDDGTRDDMNEPVIPPYVPASETPAENCDEYNMPSPDFDNTEDPSQETQANSAVFEDSQGTLPGTPAVVSEPKVMANLPAFGRTKIRFEDRESHMGVTVLTQPPMFNEAGELVDAEDSTRSMTN